MLTARERRERLISPFSPWVWLSFIPHTGTKLNHTLSLPPPSPLFDPSPRSERIKKPPALGPAALARRNVEG
jgi:hypothetical protein